MAEENLTYTEKLLKNLFQTRICPVCGKALVRVCFTDYVYKMDGHTFCSWGCMRKYEKDPKVANRRKKNTPLSKGGGRS